MIVHIHFTGFWSGFHEKTNPVHEGFFLDLFQKVYGCEVKVASFEEATVLVENTQVKHSLRCAKNWLHTYLYSGESYIRSDARAYTCVLYGQRNHANVVNVPLYVAYLACLENKAGLQPSRVKEVPSKGVLSIVSNPNGAFRNHFLDALEQRGIAVTYAGRYKNNIGKPLEPQYNSPEFQDYVKQFKFIVSMENSEEDTYITEKITHGLLAESVPIYWGSKQVSSYFNPERFIEVTDINDAVNRIATMTDQEWLTMVNQRPFTDFGQYYSIEQIAKHIRNIINPRVFPLLDQVYIICNPEFEPIRYEQCKTMCRTLGLSDDQVSYVCPTYKHTITNDMMCQYIKNDLVKRLRSIGTKRGELSLTLNWRDVMKSIVTQYRDGIFIILESDAYSLPTIADLNKCLEHLIGKRWDAINIGSGLDEGANPFTRLPFLYGMTPYRDQPNIQSLNLYPLEDLSKEGDINRYIRKFMTRCTDAHLWSYQGCTKFYDYMQTEQNYGVPFDYYLTNKAEQDMMFKYYWSSIAYFNQRSNSGLDKSTIQTDTF